jgi:hypothetical protein
VGKEGDESGPGSGDKPNARRRGKVERIEIHRYIQETLKSLAKRMVNYQVAAVLSVELRV